MTIVTKREQENSVKVLNLLSQIDGISYEQQEHRPDIFLVSESDTELTVVVDVEEDVVVSFIEVTDLVEGKLPEGLPVKLLEMNHYAVHGAYTIHDNKLYFKSNLAIENLDLNELEDSLRSVFYTVHTSLETISEYFNQGE